MTFLRFRSAPGHTGTLTRVLARRHPRRSAHLHTHRSPTAPPVLTTALAVATALAVTVSTATPATAGDAGDATVPGVPPSLTASDPTIALPADDPFYTPPDRIPATPGSLIRSQFAPQLLDAFDTGDAPGRADRILYTSTTQDGVKVATSGVVLQPSGKWNGPGPTPTVVFAPGTRGAGDHCAPSRSGALLAGVGTDNGTLNLNINYEYPFHALASALGYRVVVVDLIGLGTPGQHTYVNHTEEGHAVLDGARAGLEFAGAPADSPVAFFGYSQGGGAAAGAAELAASYAPELNVRGTFAGAPPGRLDTVAGAVDGNLIAGVLGYALNGVWARHPELVSLKDEYFNEEGHRYVSSTADECIITSVLNWGLRDSRTLTRDGRSFPEIIRADPRLRDVLSDTNLRLGSRRPASPVLVVNGRNDDTIPWSQARDTAADYCSLGATVQFTTEETASVLPRSAINHAVPLLTQAGTAFRYINDRFNNVPAPSNCGELTESAGSVD